MVCSAGFYQLILGVLGVPLITVPDSSLRHPTEAKVESVMDALNFEYPDYERFNKGAKGQKGKGLLVF
jgi:hypothetical protein